MRTGIVKEPHKFIPIGTEVACDNGHHLCETTSLILLSSPFVPDRQLDHWIKGYKPQLGEELPLRCPECGAPWLVMVPDRGLVIHFKALGWWPFEPPDGFTSSMIKRKWWQIWKPKYQRVSTPVYRAKVVGVS